jgi:hypothetical protein
VTPDRGRRFLPLAAAAAGVVLAHAVDYALLYPDPAQRGRELAATGHSYWPAAVALAAVLGAGAVGLAVVRGARRRAVPMPSISRLAAGQMALFATIEVVERLGAGVSPLSLLQGPHLAVGLVLQAAVAALAVLLLSWVERAAAKAAALLRRPSPDTRRAASWPLPLERFVEAWWAVSTSPRGPPLLPRN